MQDTRIGKTHREVRHTIQGYFSGINNGRNDIIITEVELRWLLSFLYSTEESVVMYVLVILGNGPWSLECVMYPQYMQFVCYSFVARCLTKFHLWTYLTRSSRFFSIILLLLYSDQYWCCATSKNQAPFSYNWTNHPITNTTVTYSIFLKCFEFCFVMLSDSEFWTICN